MSLSGATILIDGTVATTGGTSQALATLGDSENKHRLFIDDGSEYSARYTLEFATKEPKVSETAPNGYTQMRNTCLVKAPITPSGGAATVNTIKIEVAVDPATTDAQKLSLRVIAAQLFHDSDFLEWWDNQSQA